MDGKSPSGTGARKQDHLDLCLDGDVSFRRGNGLDRFDLVHDALPELHLDEIDISAEFLGHSLKLPLMISSMTGGSDEAARINRVLARGAQQAGCAMALGSQRAALEHRELEQSFRVRDVAPDVPLFANLGAVQLNHGYGAEECARAVEMIGADGLFLHLNSLQEALQPEGDRDFRGLIHKIQGLCRDLPFPVLLKTIGNGLSERSARKLIGIPLAGLEISGAGGTSWARVESLRSGASGDAELFGELGEDAVEGIAHARAHLGDIPLVASGGLRNGLDLAKVLALGADLGGFARTLLRPAAEGEGALRSRLDGLARELRICCFYMGIGRSSSLSPGDLKARNPI